MSKTPAPQNPPSSPAKNGDVTALAAPSQSRRRATTDLVLTGDFGSTVVSEDVVSSLAGLAVREVEGVHELVPFGTGQRLSSMASSLSGRDMRDLGVRVRVGTVECAISCRVVVDYGASIPAVADRVRDNVRKRVEQGTGLSVKRIDIDVVDLYFGEDHRPALETESVLELR